MKKIVSFFGDDNAIFRELNQEAEKYAASLGLEYKWVVEKPYDQASVIAELKKADAGIIDIEPYGETVFKEIHQNCKILTRFGVGYDKVDLKAASQYHIAIARTTGANTLGVAEMALTLMLSAHRKLKQNMNLVSEGNWEKDVTNEISDSTIGIVGYGAIGQTVAKLLQGFSCKLIAYDPYPNKEALKQNQVELVSLEELFKRSDSITVHVPYCTETHNLIDNRLLSLMKPTAVIVNTSRGNIIKEADLYTCLKEKRICGAALDVFATEPLPTSSSLLELDNIILTPHVSSQTRESLWRIYKMAIDITSDFYLGKDPGTILNPDYLV
ncbi:phosphoglycerate dehydrogenase [uncultured Sphaerochaeta sp.]|uniref:phosphoglycerate dehydrogenase n=1 Tax=uncultured Sphaerochaeta sp. TaxID=886478 RepID=UPI002A0A4637|nr:phosphoglycerate dehydrogenase [uncultured Sphaerochaeta sp.]